jgi:RNA polymerase sigma-70 factor (ECF subfamily)
VGDDRWRARFESGDLEGVCTELLERYGPEIAGFLAAMLRDEDLAAEAFSVFCEDLWRGLPKFRWQSSARTWLYTVARHAAHRTARDPRRRRERNLPISVVTAVSKLEAQLRASTAAYKRTAVKDRVRKLREQLSPDDQALLTLRLDRGLEWADVACVFLLEEARGDAPEDFEPALVKRRSAALRKRFERVKERLKKLAADEGLL